jgi:hypothetical protein
MLSDQKAVGDKFLTTDERNDINEGVAHHAEVRILPPTGLEQGRIAGQRSIALRFLDLPSVAESSDVIHSAKARTARRCRLARGKTR